MNDLTILWYSCYRIDRRFAGAVRRELARVSDAPIVVIAQNSTPHDDTETSADFTNRITVRHRVEAPPSIAQVYRNVLLGAKSAKTPFIACCEDDTIYSPSHFLYRPAPDTFAYDLSRWVITRKLSENMRRRVAFYYWRRRHQLAMCVAPRDLMIETLEERFAKHPNPPLDTDVAKKSGWGEPGRYEKNLKLTPRKMEYFQSPEPSVTFNHSESLMGRRRVNSDDVICEDLPPWGNATTLWGRIHG